MGKKNEHIDELIALYLSKGLSPEQSMQLQAWVKEAPENRKYFQQMQDIWFSAINTSQGERFDKNEAYQRFLARVEKNNKRPIRKAPLRILWQSAAAAAIIFFISFFSFKQGRVQLENRFSDIVIEAPWGSRTKTILPDGTSVWLNAGSKLTYSQGFGVNGRNVSLSGEGYFEVTHNEKLPFGVKTAEIVVNVLGTKFNFRNYTEDEEATVSLLEGKVLVNNIVKKDDNTVMIPDQKIFLNKKSGDMRIIQANVKNTIEWTNGYLFFDEELLPDIVKELERSYDVKIVITDSKLEKLRFYGNFIRKEASINEVFDVLASTGKIKYSIQGKEITLTP